MFQRDYVLRMIEMMGELMRRIKELVDELAQLRLLDEACHRHCGIPLQSIETLSAQSLIELLAPTPRLFASELLHVRSKTAGLSVEEEEALTLKSLKLLASLWEEGQVCELRAPQLLQMKEKVLDLLTANELMACAEFLYQGEQYADMEDALFQAVAISQGDERASYIARGQSLLGEAACTAERVLALAHTSSSELYEAVAELKRQS